MTQPIPPGIQSEQLPTAPPPTAQKPVPLDRVLAVVSGVFIPIVILGLLIPLFGRVREESNRIKCRHNLKCLGLMSLAYRDNIYTCNHAGGSSPASGPTGNGSGDDITNRSGPGDPADAYLLPACTSSGF